MDLAPVYWITFRIWRLTADGNGVMRMKPRGPHRQDDGTCGRYAFRVAGGSRPRRQPCHLVLLRRPRGARRDHGPPRQPLPDQGQHRRSGAPRGIPIRAGIIGLTSGQRTGQARADLIALGVSESAIALDRLRAFGRGAAGLPDEADTCGSCGHGNAAILPDGTVTPCVFTRTATAGSVLAAPLGDVLTGARFAAQVARLDSLRPASWPCVPNMCDPQCGPSCSPACRPAGTCRPVGACAPNYRQ